MSIHDFRVMVEDAIPWWAPFVFVAAMVAVIYVACLREGKQPIDNAITRNKNQFSRLAKRMDETKKTVPPDSVTKIG